MIIRLITIPLLLISTLFFYGCSNQTNSASAKTPQIPGKTFKVPFAPATESIEQIAEYVRNIHEDKNGHLWFGTNNMGVAHYDGEALSYYGYNSGLIGGQITGITEDLDRNLWFSTNEGVSIYDGKIDAYADKKFYYFSDPQLFKGNHVWSILADSKGIIWAGTSVGVMRYDGNKWARFPLPYAEEDKSDEFISKSTIWGISKDRKGNIWFGTNGNGAFKYNGKEFTQFTTQDGLTDNTVDNILEDSKGNMWFGTRFGGVSRYEGKTFTNYTEANSIGNNEACTIYEDQSGNIWFSSEGFGVYRYDGKSLTNFGTEQGLGVTAVQTIYQDSKGRLWVGGGGGLYQFDGDSFFNVSKDGPWD